MAQPNTNENANTDANVEVETTVLDEGGWAPAKHYCPHIDQGLNIPKNLDTFPKIKEYPTCNVSNCEYKENWICLKCHKLLCGRYGNKHMIDHYETNNEHCIAMGVGDLSFWCYECNDYLHHLSIQPVFEMYKIAHMAKFGTELPSDVMAETTFNDCESSETSEADIDNHTANKENPYAQYYQNETADSKSSDNDDDHDATDKRDPKNNPLTKTGNNRIANNACSGKDTVLKEDQTEYYDSNKDLIMKAKQVTALIKKSKHTVVHTGAGISTAADLPDYRGPNGVWTMKAKGISNTKDMDLDNAQPTYAHYALKEMMDNGLLQYIVSTNVDGLHAKSGVKLNKIAELHGNCYLEYCNKCGKQYLRDYNVQNLQKTIASVASVWTRFTGRDCEVKKCNGKLRDSIVSFGENLPKAELQNSIYQSDKADLNIVIGSSMRVSPACDLPSTGKKFVLINLQKTPFDSNADVRVWGKIDGFMKLVMDELKINVKYDVKKNNDNSNDKKNDEQ